MTISVGQDLSSILGSSGSFTGDGNSFFGQALAAQGFRSEAPITNSGEFNKSAMGLAAAAPEASFAPKVAPALNMGMA